MLSPPTDTKDPVGLIFSLLFSFTASVLLGLTLFNYLFPSDTYVKSEYLPAKVTNVKDHLVSFNVLSQPYSNVDLGSRCQPKVRSGHDFTATVDVMKTHKNKVYGAVNWASIRREFCR